MYRAMRSYFIIPKLTKLSNMSAQFNFALCNLSISLFTLSLSRSLSHLLIVDRLADQVVSHDFERIEGNNNIQFSGQHMC